MRLNTAQFLISQAWSAILRNGAITGAAITNISVALCVLGVFVLTAYNLQAQAMQQAAAVEITVDLAKDAKRAEVEKSLRANERVKAVRFVPKAEALEGLAQRWGLDFSTLSRVGNPLPDAFRVVPVKPDDIEAIAEQAEQIPGVAEARYAQQTTTKLLKLARGIKLAGLVAVIILGTASLLLVSVTIRLTIYARRREVRIMQLVGATNWFIRWPFLLEGWFQGTTGGIVATALLLPGYAYLASLISSNLGFIRPVQSTELMVALGIGLVLMGSLFGVLGSLIGLQRYLQEV
ncbi:MAG: ABC transporter permease [candidate division WS1 bacterium]|nr:ABC transporter permease [candidate division WS1 bacterium]